MELERTNLLGEKNLIKIRKSGCDWNFLVLNKNILFSIISSLLLDKENLLYYAASISSAKTLTDVRKYVKKLNKLGLLNENLKSIFSNLGWLDPSHAKIGNSVFEGDICEYLMNILIDKLGISNTLISKISFKTSPHMSAYGNDNIFFDYSTNSLFFGEAKFDADLYKGIYNAFSSLEEHKKNIIEIRFVRTHTSEFISPTGKKLKRITEKFETKKISDININSISFCMFQSCYKKSDIEKVLQIFIDNEKISNEFLGSNYIILFPILNKKEFLAYFIKEIEKYE